MNKEEIIELINEKHSNLFEWLDVHADKYWDYGLVGKWNTGQIILHLIQSEHPLNRALRIPKLFLKYKFGRPNRSVRSYDEIVKRYQEKLKNVDDSVVSPFSKSMDLTQGNSRQYISMLKDEHQRLIKAVDKKWSDSTLSNYLIPHPLMGRMHVSEMLMWTAYHTEHHFLQIKERAEQRLEA